MVYGDPEGVRDCSAHGLPPHILLEKETDCTKGGNITWGVVWHRDRGHARLPRLPRDIQYLCGCVGAGGVSRGFWAAGGASWSGMGGRRTEFGFLRRQCPDSGVASHLVSRRTKGDSGNFGDGGAWYYPGKYQGNGLYSRIHLGKVEQGGVQEPGDGGRGDIQGEKGDKDKLLRVRLDSGGFIPETSHGEAEQS